jgi:hypothetical protein
MVIQSEPPQARSAVTLFPVTKVSSQKKWRPMLGRKPKLMKKVGKMPPLLSGPKAKKLKTAGPQLPFSPAVARAPDRRADDVLRHQVGREEHDPGDPDQHLTHGGRGWLLAAVVRDGALWRPLGLGRLGAGLRWRGRGLRDGTRRRDFR